MAALVREASPLTDRLVVVGASAGSLEPLQQLVAGLPGDLPAPVLVVVHLQPGSVSALPKVLARAGVLPAAQARNGDALQPGRILVAPPDRHLLVHDSWVRLSRGPRENGQRPAIDTLFRSAAAAHGPGVVAVVLSGALDDGAVGAAVVAAQDGAVLVQDPDEARVSSMPRAALAAVRRARALPAAALAAAVSDLVRGPVEPGQRAPEPDLALPAAPGCARSAQTLLDAEQQAVESAIHNAATTLLELAAVHRRLAQLAAGRGKGDPEEHLRAARAAEERARRIEELATEDPGPS